MAQSRAVCLLSLDTKLQTVSIPDILFPTPRLPFHFLKKQKPQNLNQNGPCIPAWQEFATGQFTKNHHEVSVSLLQSPKETTLISARALADKSKQGPVQNTCFLTTAWDEKLFLTKMRELVPWLAVHHLQFHPFPPRAPWKAWQALAGDLKSSWFFETSVRSTVTQLTGGSGEQPKNIRAFSSFSCRDNRQVGKREKAHCPCSSRICLKKTQTKHNKKPTKQPEQNPQRSAEVRTKSR